MLLLGPPHRHKLKAQRLLVKDHLQRMLGVESPRAAQVTETLDREQLRAMNLSLTSAWREGADDVDAAVAEVLH